MTADRPLVTLVIPAYNESALLEANVALVDDYLSRELSAYRWEFIIVNDGSRDNTGEIADRIAANHPGVRVVHHPRNFGLGQAFKSGFNASRGDYVVTIDIDLSYGPEHIKEMLERIRATRAKLVLASPYMAGGSVGNVPWLRRVLSVGANRFLGALTRGGFATLTCMVRAYDGPFIRSLTLRASGMEVMPETIYKSMVMRGRIVEIPARLDWSRQLKMGAKRQSSMRIARHMFATVLSGFLFRPFMFFVLPGLALLGFALWVNVWMVVHFFDALAALPPDLPGDRISAAVGEAYSTYPHTFIVGLLSLMLSIQLISLGIAALQTKNYFEELFYLGTTLRREIRESRRPDDKGSDSRN
jgi:glycosyltransferase involved in cell wall biosynthesis